MSASPISHLGCRLGNTLTSPTHLLPDLLQWDDELDEPTAFTKRQEIKERHQGYTYTTCNINKPTSVGLALCKY